MHIIILNRISQLADWSMHVHSHPEQSNCLPQYSALFSWMPLLGETTHSLKVGTCSKIAYGPYIYT